ncbi:MAG: type II toxin-antitoxin system Phd/YefM family antitoxin [Streptomycetales bacterium]
MGGQSEISVRELRNHVSEVLRRVEAGERLRVTVDRRPVAQIVPLPARRTVLPFPEYLRWRTRGGGADPQLADDLADALPDTTDDLRE